tara:strand:+ start:776 stop:1165 length:390 start_codon:yes stop_codon:yes gene_type:complete
MIHNLDGGVTLQQAVDSYCGARADAFEVASTGELECALYLAEVAVEEKFQERAVSPAEINGYVNDFIVPYGGKRAYRFVKQYLPTIKEDLCKMAGMVTPNSVRHLKGRRPAPRKVQKVRDKKGKWRVFV